MKKKLTPLILAVLFTVSGSGANAVESVPVAEQKTIVVKDSPKKIKKVAVVIKKQLTAFELKDVLYTAGFRGKDLVEAWGTAMKESMGKPFAHNKNSRTGDNSYGLFQINMIGSLGPARLKQYNLKTNKDLFDPLTNAKIAFQMSNGGKDWSAWHGITDKTKSFMAEFPG